MAHKQKNNKKEIDVPKHVAVKKDDDSHLYEVELVSESQAHTFQEMFDLNKTYAAYLEQYNKHKMAVEIKERDIKGFNSGEYSPDVMVPISQNVFRREHRKEEIVNRLRQELRLINEALDNIRCQIEQKKDEYMESMIRCRNILVCKTANKEITTTNPHLGYREVDDRKIFEKELGNMSDADALEEIKKAEKIAAEKNKELI